jgi:serine protease Do
MNSESISHHYRQIVLTAVCSLVIGGALGIVATAASGFANGGTSAATFTVASDPPRAAVPVAPTIGFAPIVKQALPAVVNISSSKMIKVRNNLPSDPFFSDPFFQQFFGQDYSQQFRNRPQQEREHSLGSGVIVAKNGYILTNNHVVDGASEITVDLADKRHFTAKVVGTDPQFDLAVLKIDANDLQTLTFGDSKKLEIGDYVLAIGDPFGVGETVTMGIVSATGRTNVGIEGQQGYEDFIQTDAAINPGNSGGALIDAHGDLVGINTAIATSSGGNEGVGFAIPIDMARNVMTQLIEHGKVVRGYLGVGIEQMTPALAKQFGVSRTEGAVITQVDPGTPAAKAGLRQGDVILAMDGQTIADYTEFRLRIAQAAPNTTVQLKVWRSGKEIDVPVTLGEQPANLQAASNGQAGPAEGVMSGVQVEDLTPQIARQLGVSPSAQGVVVSQVASESAAAQSGLQQGDVIEEVNHQAVHNVQEFNRALAHGGKNSALLLVARGNQMLYIAIESQ